MNSFQNAHLRRLPVLPVLSVEMLSVLPDQRSNTIRRAELQHIMQTASVSLQKVK